MPLVDIGGGIKQFVSDTSASAIKAGTDVTDPLAQTKSTLGLVDLFQKIQGNALDRSIKEQRQQINKNEIANFNVDNLKKQADLLGALNSEKRAQSKFIQDQIKTSIELYRENPALGAIGFKQLGMPVIQSEDGTAEIRLPGTEQSFTIDPNHVADPAKRADMERQRRESWMKNSKDFTVQNTFFRNMKNLAALGTPQGDIGIVFAYMKLLDPGSTVREGEQATARNAPGVSDQIRGLYNRFLTEKGSFFNDAARDGFINAGKVLVDNAKDERFQAAKFIFETADNVNPDNILQPIGGVDFRVLVKEEQERERVPESLRRPEDQKKRPVSSQGVFIPSEEDINSAPGSVFDSILGNSFE